jgi:hypothetical protein
METKKRARRSEVLADSDIARANLLAHWDDRCQLEQRQESKRHRGNIPIAATTGTRDVNQDESSPQVFLPLWRGCLRRLRCASVGNPIIDTGNSTGGEPRLPGDVGSDDDDLLKHLEVERLRELNRLRQRRFQTRRREQR